MSDPLLAGIGLDALLSAPPPVPKRRRSKETGIPTRANFWDELAATRDASLGHTGERATTLPDDWAPPVSHKGHRGFNARSFTQCHECALRNLRRALMEGENTHPGRNARRERDIRVRAGLKV